MDPSLLRLANLSVGNEPGDAGLEWALGPLSLRLSEARWVSGLGQAELRIDGARPEDPARVRVPAGGMIELLPGQRPLFCYLAVEGGLAVEPVLGSRATYLPGGFGGYQGRRLRPGDRIPLGAATGRSPSPAGPLALDREAVEVAVRVTRGPQWDRFAAPMQEAFLAATFTVDRASDRMGYRLTGPSVAPKQQATLPSEAACPGAVQVPDNGQPIVIMPDGPTVGGYPKIAVVIRADLRLLAQSPPGTRVRFVMVSLEEARRIILWP
jgi:biotin-dependent carboxylase-like uncharacterized protein